MKRYPHSCTRREHRDCARSLLQQHLEKFYHMSHTVIKNMSNHHNRRLRESLLVLNNAQFRGKGASEFKCVKTNSSKCPKSSKKLSKSGLRASFPGYIEHDNQTLNVNHKKSLGSCYKKDFMNKYQKLAEIYSKDLVNQGFLVYHSSNTGHLTYLHS